MASSSPASVPYFSGYSYQMPNALFGGDPWLFSDLRPGVLFWLGSDHAVKTMRYDLVLDKLTLLIPSTDRDALISLSPLLVDRFSIGDRRFFMPAWLPAGEVPSALTEGYHEKVYTGEWISFLVKHKKVFLSESRSYTIEYSFDDRSSRFIYVEGEYHKFKSQKGLLKAMKKHKKAIRKMIKSRSILVRKATLSELIPLFELYESLSAGE